MISLVVALSLADSIMADEDCPSSSKTFEFSEADYSEILLKDSYL